MNYPRTCDGQRQPCPSPWSCTTGCNFNNAEKETPREKAARQFAEMPLPIDMQPDLGDEVLAWFQRWTRWIAGACLLIAAVVAYFGRSI